MKEFEKDITEITGQHFTEERALFAKTDLRIADCAFDTGESPLKEGRNLTVVTSTFDYKYPFWYCENVSISDSTLKAGARAGIWYTSHITMADTDVLAPKNFRRCRDVTLRNVNFPDARETFWNCRDVELADVTVTGDYFAMGCENVVACNLTLNGNYGFDGVKNLTIRNSTLHTKDAFWNCEDVTVYDSKIVGEYLGWNTKNLTLIGCEIESLQGMCYIENLVMKDCVCTNTNLAFEYSTVDAELTGSIKSVLNPTAGKIVCGEIGELIYEEDKADPAKTDIVCGNILKRSDSVDWDNI